MLKGTSFVCQTMRLVLCATACHFNAAATLILHIHCVRIDRFFSGRAFKSGKHAPIVAFVSLESHAALLPGVIPGQTDEVFL